MIRHQELRDNYEDLQHLLQINNPNPDEDIRIKKLCTCCMTLIRAVDRQHTEYIRDIRELKNVLRENADLLQANLKLRNK